MEDEEASPLVDGSFREPPRLPVSPRSIGSRSRQAVLERRKARAETPPRAGRPSLWAGEAGEGQPEQPAQPSPVSPRPLPPLAVLSGRRGRSPPRESSEPLRRLSPTPPGVDIVAATRSAEKSKLPGPASVTMAHASRLAKQPQPQSRPRSTTDAARLSAIRQEATSEQSAKVSDEMLTASIMRIQSIPPVAKANPGHLVHVLRQHLKWVPHPPGAHRVLFQEGDDSNNEMFFVAEGALEVLVGTELKNILEAGRSLGEVCIGNPDICHRTATARALSDGLELLTLNTEAFRQALYAVHATFVGSEGALEPEDALRDDEWDWCLSFGCEIGKRKLPSSVAPSGTSAQPVSLRLPCSWEQWPRDGFTLAESCVFIGTGTLTVSSENWCELKGDGTKFLSEIRSKDMVVVHLSEDGAALGIDTRENALAHAFTVHAVLDDQTVQVTRPVQPGLQVSRVEYQVRRTVDTWGEAQWQAQGDWEALTFDERSRRRMAGAMVTPVEVKLLASDPFYRLMDTYMHRPWLCPVHTLKLGFLKAGLEVRERISNQYDVLFLMVRARDDVLEKTADASRLNLERGVDSGECFLRNIIFDADPENANSSGQDGVLGFSTRPDESDSGDGKTGIWGHVLGMLPYDSHLRSKFEDRRLNSRVCRRDRSVFKSDKRFPHPRYFHSGERQVLVKILMESVEWARYVPHQRRRWNSRRNGASGDDASSEDNETLTYSVYNVQFAEKDGIPAAKAPRSQQAALQKTRDRFTLCDSVGFGPPLKVGASTLSRRPLESPLWTTLRDSENTPLHDVLPAHQDDNEITSATSELPSFTKIILDQWRHRTGERHELMMYPFRVQEVQKVDLTQRRDRKEDSDAEVSAAGPAYRKGLHIHKLPRGLELFVLERDTSGENDGRYFMHYLHRGQTYKDFHEKLHRDHRDVANGMELYRTESIREERTFLLDCQPLHCPYEHEFLQSVWGDWRNIFSSDCLNLPLDHIQGYFGSQVAFYYAWLQCYTWMLIYPAAFGLILQLIVWWPPTPFPGSVATLGGWVAAYCLFVSLWSSMFFVKWTRTQSILQQRWGLTRIEEHEALRKEWLDCPVPADDASETRNVPLTRAEKLKQKWEYRDYAHVKPTATGSTLDSARYSSKGMHAARLTCSCVLVLVSACVVILVSLSALVLRTRGTNTIVGSVAAWTTVEFDDVSIEFWTIYEDQCADLIPTPCDEKTWVDNINHCGECKVLVDNFDTKYGGLCENFCRAQGLDCAGIWDEVDDTCAVKPDSEVVGSPLSCSVPYLDSSDAICECVPPQSGQAARTATCDRPDPAKFRPDNAVYGFPPTSNSTHGGIEYGWRHSERAVVRSPALCDERRADCTVENLEALEVLVQSQLLQSVPAAQLVVPMMLNEDEPHSSLPLRVPVYEPSCSELSTWVNLSRTYGQESIRGGLAIGLLRQPFGLRTGAVRKAEWSVANINVVTSVYMFMDSRSSSANAADEHCTIQMDGTVSNNVVARSTDESANTAMYFRAPDPSLGTLLVYASTALSVTFIALFGMAWKTVARWMNDWENHRTHHEYEDAYVFKQYVFQFINYYFMLVYIAYLKKGTPVLSYSIEHRFGWEIDNALKQDVLRLNDASIPVVEMKEACIPNPDSLSEEPDCMYELFTQLVFLFVGKQFALEAWENIKPKLTRKASIIKMGKNTPVIELVNVQPTGSTPDTLAGGIGAIADRSEDPNVQQCYDEFSMPQFGDKDIDGCLDDYNEMMIQLGFVTLFAAAFPGGAFFALLNNIYEMRSDGDAQLSDFQRPSISVCTDIGAWGGVMHTITFVAVISNSFIIGFTSAAAFELLVDEGEESSSIEDRYIRYDLWAAVIVVEHLMLLGKLLIETSFSKVPNRVRRAEAELKHYESALHDDKMAKLAMDAAAAR